MNFKRTLNDLAQAGVGLNEYGMERLLEEHSPMDFEDRDAAFLLIEIAKRGASDGALMMDGAPQKFPPGPEEISGLLSRLGEGAAGLTLLLGLPADEAERRRWGMHSHRCLAVMADRAALERATGDAIMWTAPLEPELQRVKRPDSVFRWNALTPAGGGFIPFTLTWFPIIVATVFLWMLVTDSLGRLNLIGWLLGPIGLYPAAAVVLNYRNVAILTPNEIIIRRGLIPWFGWQRLRVSRSEVLRIDVRSEMTLGNEFGDSPDRYEVHLTLRDGSTKRIYRKFEGNDESGRLKAFLDSSSVIG